VEKHWFKATGPAVSGFNAEGANIDVGGSFGGRQVGAVCKGQTGVVASGEAVGVAASGRAFGIVGTGEHGRGGRFESPEFTAQVQLRPHPPVSRGDGRAAQQVAPREFTEPHLPKAGAKGDLYLAGFKRDVVPDGMAPLALWLCVESGGPKGPGAKWCQVLLGNMLEGTAAGL
jgi:hypothetical protein